MTAPQPLSKDALRWRCDPDAFSFETTDELDPTGHVVGQDTAVEALRFGLEIHAPGQNIFVRGLVGTGRSTLVQRLMREVKPACPLSSDRAYVYNFRRPDRPRLITLPRGQGERFRTRIDTFIDFVKRELAGGLRSDVVKARGQEIEAQFSDQLRESTQPFENELREAGYGMLTIQAGPASRQLIVPLIENEPATPERLQALRQQGAISDEQMAAWDKEITDWNQRLQEVGEVVADLRARREEQLQTLVHTELRGLLDQAARSIRLEFPHPPVYIFLDEVIEDIVLKRMAEIGENEAFTERYRVNVVLSHATGESCPTIVEHAPSPRALLGSIDPGFDPEGDAVFTPQMMIRGGSLLQADGGFLVLDATDLVSEPGAYKSLMRTLRSGVVEWMPPTAGPGQPVAFIKPEPIPVNVKVILIGDASIYYMLDAIDSDFRAQFKVLADFDSVIARNDEGLQFYADVIAGIGKAESLPPFTKAGVAALCEHGARIAAQGDKLTSRFGRLADLQREAAFLAKRASDKFVTDAHVFDAVKRTKQRANLPSRRFQEMIGKGVIRIRTSGEVVGQVNGLAVIQAGQLTYGFPNRITATIAPGTAGTINVEEAARLSGQIHTKGFLILGGVLRTLLRPEHPLTFSASVTFEQSYGGVDGDSASGIEVCCLLSALTELPIRQDLAMTGAIDQHGDILPIGGANEKIEGFYDACQHNGLTGSQGVIIPLSNAADLMLRADVVEACDSGQFHVYAVDRVHEAIELLFGMPAGDRDGDGVLGRAVERAHELWLRSAKPRRRDGPSELRT